MKRSLTPKVLIFVFLFTLFIGAAYAQAKVSGYAQEMNKLPALISALQTEKVTVKAWSVYARENSKTVSNLSSYFKEVRTLENHNEDIQWTPIAGNKNEQLKATGTRINKDYQETISYFAYPHKDGYRTYLIYEVNGKSWNEKKWGAIKGKINDQLSGLFQSKNGKIFTWASGEIDGTMDVGMNQKAKQFLTDLNATEIEKDKDKTFVSLSAYNKYWKDLIQTNGNKMNLQIGLRKTGGKTTVTLGTPIITAEY
ncbi:membrane protein [Pullulanibacillus camelliae]|uniref:Membrane protein n=1 Tax=Pullulanibacillus camelliae TaxID=1707096 RepID=A0A8J2YFA0_9BACL|nr:YwmB family TATA-box binding protein [Pullulanibacillus camelliae]GGE28384.1 membrane protein [Pullulanibacillus camelliae]